MNVTQINFYNIDCKKNVIDKSDCVDSQHLIETVTGTLRDSLSITSPQVIIDLSTTTVLKNNFEYVNYVEIPSLARYYFITDIILERKDLVRFVLKCDVLMSFHTLIISSQQHGFVARNEYNYSSLLPDESRRIMKNEYETDVTIYDQIKTPASDTLVNDYFAPYLTANEFNVVLNCIDRTTFRPLNDYKAVAQSIASNQLTNLDYIRGTFNLTATCVPNVCTGNSLATILWRLNELNDEEVASFVSSIYVYPFRLDNPDVQESVVDANDDVITHSLYINETLIYDDSLHSVQVGNLKSVYSDEHIIADFDLANLDISDFTDLPPYANYDIFIPYYGWKELEIQRYLGHRILLVYRTNFITNETYIFLYDYTDSSVIWSTSKSIGIEIGINTTNLAKAKDRSTANGLNTIMGYVSSALSIGMGASTGNVGAVMKGATGLMKSTGTAINTERMNYNSAHMSLNSNSDGLFTMQEVFIRKIKRLTCYQNDADFRHENGAPLNTDYNGFEYISGYTEFAEVEFKLFNDGVSSSPTDSEVNEIVSLLKSGVYFPPL